LAHYSHRFIGKEAMKMNTKIHLVYKIVKTEKTDNRFHRIAYYFDVENAYAHAAQNPEYFVMGVFPTIAELSCLHDKSQQEIQELIKKER